MNGAKIKNIILLILAALNLFLAAFVWRDGHAVKRAEKEALADMTRVLQSRGIAITADLAQRPGEFRLRVYRRDPEREVQLVKAVLGAVTTEDLGGHIYYYAGDVGMAKYRGSGDFEIYFNGDMAHKGADKVKTAEALMKRMSIPVYSPMTEVSEENGTTVVTLYGAIDKSCVYNCKVRFTFYADSLLVISGRRPLDKAVSETSGELLDLSTVLMRFLDALNAEGAVCSELREAQLGGIFKSSLAGDTNLTPVWRIETDVKDYYINAITGEVEFL